MSYQTTAVELAILSSAAFPECADAGGLAWIPNEMTIPPTSGGVSVAGATRAQVTIAPQRSAVQRRAWVSFTVPDLAATYTTVFIGTDTVIYDASLSTPADLEELIAEWAAAINADPVVGRYILAAPDADDPEVLTLTYLSPRGKFDVAVSGTTAEYTLTVEPDAGDILLLGRSSASISISDPDDRATAAAVLAGWQPLVLAVVGVANFTYADGLGLRMNVDCAGLEALLVVMTGQAKGDDSATGGASSALEVSRPYALIAPCRVRS